MNSAHLIKLYIVYFLLTSIGLALVVAGLLAFLDLDLGGSLGIVTVILPAMLVGHRYAKRWNKRPQNGYAWRLTFGFTLVNFIAGLLLVTLYFSLGLGVEDAARVFADIGLGYIIGFAVVMFALLWAVGRFFFGFGAKNQLKSMAEEAARLKDDQNQP